MIRSLSTSWYHLCTLHAGIGRVELLLPETVEEIHECISRCLDEGVKPFVLGSGTNIVGSDDDYICRAIRLPGKPTAKVNGHLALCSAGTLGRRVFRMLATAELGGCAAISSIPGTLGGMLAMNAGANDMEICDVVAEMHGVTITTGEKWIWMRGDGGWGYRESPVPKDVFVTDALLELRDASPVEELMAISAELQRRRRVTPSWWSAGSVFRNPSPEMPAGKLLEGAGCKGLSWGPFTVSQRHANWIVNEERRRGSAGAVKWLVSEMRRKVAVPLECELRFVDSLLSC